MWDVMSDTKLKGTLGAAKAFVAFAEMGIQVFQAVGSEHLPYDFVIATNEGFKKVQVKYREGVSGRPAIFVPVANGWSNSKGHHSRRYSETDFDVLALYVREVDRVLFLSFDMCGKSIALKKPQTSHYWWEDFLTYPPVKAVKRESDASQRSRVRALERALKVPATSPRVLEPKKPKDSVIWPDAATLTKRLELEPVTRIAAELGVSGTAVRKHCLGLGIPLRPRGYWAKQKAQESAAT